MSDVGSVSLRAISVGATVKGAQAGPQGGAQDKRKAHEMNKSDNESENEKDDAAPSRKRRKFAEDNEDSDDDSDWEDNDSEDEQGDQQNHKNDETKNQMDLKHHQQSSAVLNRQPQVSNSGNPAMIGTGQLNLTTQPPIPRTKAEWIAQFRAASERRDQIYYGLVEQNLNVDAESPETIVKYFKRKLAHSENYSVESLKAILANWMRVTLVDSAENAMRYANRLYVGGTEREFKTLKHEYGEALQTLQGHMQQKQLLNAETPDGQIRIRELDAVKKNLDNLLWQKLLSLDLLAATKTHLSGNLQELQHMQSQLSSHDAEQAKYDEVKMQMSEYALLLNTILDRAKDKGLVRINRFVHEPIKTPEGYFTRCYRLYGKHGSIEEFVYGLVKEIKTDPELWSQFYSKPQYGQMVIKELKTNYDSRLPCLEESRFAFGWRNGLYYTDTDRFYPYTSLAFKHLPDDLVGCMYTDQVFDNDAYEFVIQTQGWMHLDTPELDAVPRVQKWDIEQAKWWYACEGRMLYPSNYKEKWGRMPYHMGMAGTGKTSSLEFSMKFTPIHRLGLVQNIVEKVFGFQGLLDKWNWFVPDVGPNWGLDQKMWNRIVEGGPVDVYVKREAPTRVDWDRHGAACGNDWIMWQDLNGEFMRRMIVFRYNEFPHQNEGRPRLSDEMDKLHKAISLKKINVAYLEKVKEFGHRRLLENMFPESMQENLREMGKHTNPLLAFLSSSTLVMNPNYWIDVATFRKAFMEYTAVSRIRGAKNIPQFDSGAFCGILQLKKCSRESDPKKLPWLPDAKGERPTQPGEWIVGCTLSEFQHLHPNCPPGFKPTPSLIPSPSGASYGGQQQHYSKQSRRYEIVPSSSSSSLYPPNNSNGKSAPYGYPMTAGAGAGSQQQTFGGLPLPPLPQMPPPQPMMRTF